MKQIRTMLQMCLTMLLVMGISSIVYAQKEKIDINTATVQELTQLEGIGPKKASAIVEYREKNGLFKSPGDIIKISGIGSKTYEINKDRIIATLPIKATPSAEKNTPPITSKQPATATPTDKTAQPDKNIPTAIKK